MNGAPDTPAAAGIARYIRTIPDYPKPGVMFRDISTLIGHPEGLRLAVEGLCTAFAGHQPQKIAGIEARGFILGGAVARNFDAGFIPLRKQGKLPAETVQIRYELEYGSACMELHRDAVVPGERVLVIDDLIATGGTAIAAVALLRELGADILGLGAVIDLPELHGSTRLRREGIELATLCSFPGS